MADGATGNNLFMRGLETGYPPELWNVERPDDIIGLYISFFEAGSDLSLTDSFVGNALRLKLHEAQDRVAELNAAAARFARMAADSAADRHGRRPILAVSMGPTGELFEPIGTLTHETTRDVFAAQGNAFADGGVDILWIETMSSTDEVAAALEAAKATALPVAVPMTFDTAARSMMGVSQQDFAVFGNANKADFLGANCAIGSAELLHSIAGMGQAHIDNPLIAKGNCGAPS